MISSVRSNVESYLRRNSNNIMPNLIKGAGVGLLLGGSYLTYKILCLLLPTFISLLILGYLLYRLIYAACRIGTFPGSTWFWRRNIENQFQRVFVINKRKRIILLRKLIEYILEERLWYNFDEHEGIDEIRPMIISTLHNFQKQVRHKTLNNKQREFMELFAEIEQLLSETRITNKADNSSLSVWAFLLRREEIVNKPRTILCFEQKENGVTLLNKTFQLENKLYEIVCKKPLRQMIPRWIHENSFGTLDQLREELDNRYKCNPISLKTEKDVVLDCVLVSGHIGEDDQHEEAGFGNRRDGGQEPQISDKTIIFCCPNAGYYEYMYGENEWIELYLRNGFNIFLWNYRGYGRSTGTPEPNSFRKDADAIVDFLRQDLKMKKIGVHGESLGGIAVTHIGRSKNIDYLCADRTFAGVSNVVEISFGMNIAKLFRIITLWDDKIAHDYAESNCHKILTYDPKDEIIHLLSSLKFGVTNQVALQRLGVNSHIPRSNLKERYSLLSPYRIINLIQKVIEKVKLEFHYNKLNNILLNDRSLLTRPQMQALFWAFHRLSELFIQMASLNALNGRKNTGKSLSPKTSGSVQPGKPGGDSSTNDESISLNQSVEIGQNEYELRKSIEIKSYKDLLDGEDGSSDAALELISQICSIFEDLEAGGLFVSDIMSYKQEYRYRAFQHFILSFEIWGSYYPLEEAATINAKDLSYYQQNAALKLKDFMKRIEKILYAQRQHQAQSQNKLLSCVLDDLELINSIIPTLYSKLDTSQKKASLLTNATESTGIYNQDDVKIDFSSSSSREARERLRSTRKDSGSDTTFSETPDVGFLVPLTCGHNGTPRPHEIKHFEYIFQNFDL